MGYWYRWIRTWLFLSASSIKLIERKRETKENYLIESIPFLNVISRKCALFPKILVAVLVEYNVVVIEFFRVPRSILANEKLVTKDDTRMVIRVTVTTLEHETITNYRRFYTCVEFPENVGSKERLYRSMIIFHDVHFYGRRALVENLGR